LTSKSLIWFALGNWISGWSGESFIAMYPEISLLIDDSTRTFAADKKGYIWIGYKSHGVLK